MRVLLTNARLEAWYGSELYLLDVARWLREQGHEPIAYSARLGPFAEAMRREGFVVLGDLEAMDRAPDLIHGQHHLATLTALAHFPGVPAVGFCHGVAPWEETPVVHPQIRRYVAVSDITQERLLAAGIAPERVRVIPNFVDTDRFPLRGGVGDRPRSALLLSNHARPTDSWVQQLREACLERGLSLDVVGNAAGNPVATPAEILPRYDLVFARGRAALEAMATGAAVIVCDVEGLASLATPDAIDGLRAGNFGMQVLVRPLERELLADEIDRYDPELARQASQIVRMTLSRNVVLPRLMDVYREAIADYARAELSPKEASRALAAHLRNVDALAPVTLADSNDRAAVARAVAAREAEAALAELAKVRHQYEALRHDYDTLRSRFLVNRVVPVMWRLRKRVAPSRSRRYGAYMRVRSLGRGVVEQATQPTGAEAPRPSAETANTYPPDASLTAVVMDLGGQPGLLAAVRSLIAQEPRPEIVVVSSGGGTAAQQLRDARLEVDVVTTPVTLMPGAARNLGIAATHSQNVAFLAADCVAAPGWVAGRLAAHAAGARIVSSAVVNDAPNNPSAVAGHALLFASRLPGTPTTRRLHYGASYDRGLFREYGRFRDDLRVGEDSEFHARIGGAAKPVFRKDVRVAHRNPRSLRELVADHYARGARAANARHDVYREPPAAARRLVATNSLRRLGGSFALAWRASSWRERLRLVIASPWLVPAAAAYSVGAARSRTDAGSPAARPRLPLVALLQFRNEARYVAEYLAHVAPQVDGIIALDDGSTDGSADILRGHPSVMEVLRLDQIGEHVWDERRNRAILVDAAIRHRAEWAIAVDADERLEGDFRSRADELIKRADADGTAAFALVVRELWDSESTYRADGIWGQKKSARMFRVPAYYEASDMAFHGHWPPKSAHPANGQFELTDLVIYHRAMIDPADREARKLKFKRLDPESKWQEIGYDYLTDETGLELAHVPDERDFPVTIPR